jgi:hypothetical protein
VIEVSLPEPIYIAGPMTGRLRWNYDAFHGAQRLLEGYGYREFRNPAAHDLDPDDPTKSPEWWLKRALKLLLECSSVVLLDEWWHSWGATTEFRLARDLGMPAHTLREVMREHDRRPRREPGSLEVP